MRINRDIRWMVTSCLLFASLIVPDGAPVAAAGDQDWVETMLQAVLVEQAKDLGGEELFSPYVAQLVAVRAYLVNGDNEAVYRTMNRLMEMLQAREAGISAEAADRLFDYCYLVTPPRYHDVSRHLHRLSWYRGGSPSA